MDDIPLFQLIRDRMEMDEILDLAGVGVGELTLRFRHRILENRERFEDYLEIYEHNEVDND